MASDQNWREKGEWRWEESGRGERDLELPATMGWWGKIARDERRQSRTEQLHLQLSFVQSVDEEFILLYIRIMNESE